ncbi:hypothetical protein QYF36_014591 [Acer negundo]|nr:hypothetical protein QYF36_014591 [Acer negundo]
MRGLMFLGAHVNLISYLLPCFVGKGKHALKTEGHLGMWKKPLTNAFVLYLCFNVYEAILISLPSVYMAGRRTRNTGKVVNVGFDF